MNKCPICEGRGFDPLGYGITAWDTLCPECLGLGRCPECGAHLELSAEGHFVCVCGYDTYNVLTSGKPTMPYKIVPFSVRMYLRENEYEELLMAILYALRRGVYLGQWRHACRHCDGKGQVEAHDLVDYGSTVVTMTTFEPCPKCLGVDQCPRCAAGPLEMRDVGPDTYDHCPVCGWDSETTTDHIPPLWEPHGQ